jgi:hypothetical protein
MSTLPAKITLPKLEGDLLTIRLVREIAIDQHDLETILERNGVTPRQFQRIRNTDRFKSLLAQEIASWNSAANTPERVKIKSAAMIEEWLPEAFAQMHNGDASLLHRTNLAQLVSSLAGMGKSEVGVGSSGERFSITINMGGDAKLKFDKETLPAKVIEGTVND